MSTNEGFTMADASLSNLLLLSDHVLWSGRVDSVKFTSIIHSFEGLLG
jgi:hypothetical protein